jgi:hypothetical protein
VTPHRIPTLPDEIIGASGDLRRTPGLMNELLRCNLVPKSRNKDTVESPSLVLEINDTKLLMLCVKCFELGISNTCDEGVCGKEWWPQDHMN